MPNLEKLVCKVPKWCILPDDEEPSTEKLPPPLKLKSLEVNTRSPALAELLAGCRLHTLTVSTSINIWYYVQQESEGIWDFLATQGDLKALKMDYRSCSALFGSAQGTIPFTLKKFAIVGSASHEMMVSAIGNLVKFMKQQEGTLEELELCSTLPNNFYESILKLRNLKTLLLPVDRIPQVPVGWMRSSGSVTKLRLNILVRVGSALAARAFVRYLPNIKTLQLEAPFDSLLVKYVADNMKHLATLDLGEADGNTFCEARFSTLKTLRIRKLEGPVDWGVFAQHNLGITELWIGEVGDPSYLDVANIAAITRNFRISNFTIESSYLVCNSDFFAIIRQNCPGLKSLDVNERSLKVDISTVADIPGLRFRQY